MPTNPTASQVHVDVPLTNFAQLYAQRNEMFVAMRAAPNMPVPKQSDLYYVFARADFYRDEMEERADGAETEGSGFDLSTSPYFCRVYGHHKLVTDRQRTNADPRVDLERSAATFVMHKGLIKRERTFAAAYMGTGIWDTDLTGVSGAPGAGQFQGWNETGSDPIRDFRTGKETVQGLTGYVPNKLCIGQSAYNALLDNDAVLDRIQGGATPGAPALVMRQLLASILELDEIFVMGGVYNSAARGATESTGFITSDDALLYYAPDSIGPNEPTAMTQFSWTGYLPGQTENGIVISRLRNDDRRADKIEGEMAFDYRVTGSELGYFFTNAVV